MTTHTSLLGKSAGFLLVMSVASLALGQSILIDSTTRNGSFEDGVLPPWNAGFSVLQDPGFASEGIWYASVQTVLIRPILGIQNLDPNPNAGLMFLLSFDARMDTPGLDIVAPSMSARTPEGAPLSAGVTTIAAPPLSTSAWQSYQYELLMPESWDNAGITFGISFNKDQPLGGITHIAYLDNVVLIQVPEPSSLALLACGGALLAACLLRHGWKR